MSKMLTMSRQMLLSIFVGGLFGVVMGVGGYTFVYARGASYLTNDPAACANCHIMKDHFDAWRKSSHHHVAVCNDCHAPHDLIGKYQTKAINGFNHSLAFTTNRYPYPLQITARNKAITEETCRYCHADIVLAIDTHHEAERAMSCIGCHNSVGHLH